MRYTKKGSLMALAVAAPLAAATMLSVNSPAHSQQFMLGQGLMMVQGDMDPGRMMGRGGPMGVMRSLAGMMDPSRMMGPGSMADMDEQQMREMMDRCDEMMERYRQEEDQSAARQ